MKRWNCRGKKLIAFLMAFAICMTATAAYADVDMQPQETHFFSPIIVNDTVRVYSLKKDGDTYLSDNFQVKELASHDGADTVCIDGQLIDVLQNIRDHFGAPVTVTSGYRTEKHNAAVGGVANSYHTKGMAADIKVKGYTPLEVAQYAQQLGVSGIGCYSTWVHVETRVTNVYYWDGDGNPVESFLTETAGDVDGNSEVEAKDALLVLKQVVSLQVLTQKQLVRADMNGDGKLTSHDALQILQKVVHIF